MAHTLQLQMMENFAAAIFFSVIADRTTNITGLEQFSISIRFVESATLESREEFVGMYSPDDTTGKTLTACIEDVFYRLNLPLDKLRGECFDGAIKICLTKKKGVITRLKMKQLRCLYVHCSNHASDLPLQEIAKNVRDI